MGGAATEAAEEAVEGPELRWEFRGQAPWDIYRALSPCWALEGPWVHRERFVWGDPLCSDAAGGLVSSTATCGHIFCKATCMSTCQRIPG